MVRRRSFPWLVLLLSAVPAFAASHVWTGAEDDRFSNASNWIGGSPAGDAAAEVSFPASSRPRATNDLDGVTLQSLSFSAGGFAIDGNSITLAPNATVVDSSQAINAISSDLVLAGSAAFTVTGSAIISSGAQILTLTGRITGPGGMTLRGGGNLQFGGLQPNTYAGATTVLSGVLQLGKPSNVTAIAGDVDIEGNGNQGEYGRLDVLNDEEIAKTAHITIGRYATFESDGTQTLGPLTLTRGAYLTTARPSRSPTGTIILAGDVEINGTNGQIQGTILLDGIRNIKADAGDGAWMSGVGQKTPGSGIVLTADANATGSYNRVLDFSLATYDGPTTIKGGSVAIDAPQSAVDLQGGGYTGHCKSLTAEGGRVTISITYRSTVSSEGDVRLSPGVTVAQDVEAAMTLNGTLDLGGATLQLVRSSSYNYGAVYKIIDNKSTKPVTGTFANLPEGATVASRYVISYVGGDGNDVTLTDYGLVPTEVILTISPYQTTVGSPVEFTASVWRADNAQFINSGTVTFSAGTTVLGTAPVIGGIATLTAGASLPAGYYHVTASYSGDSRIAPSSSVPTSLNIAAVYSKPTLTSIDPSTVTARVSTTLTLHGTNFVDGTTVFMGQSYTPTYVSPTELRVDFTALTYKSDYQIDVSVVQPDHQQSDSLKLNVVVSTSSPFTFGGGLTTTVSGITPGAMTFWFAISESNDRIEQIAGVAIDTDHDGIVTVPQPVLSLFPAGVWTVADLNSHAIVADNVSHTVPAAKPFPTKVFLRDAGGNFTYVQFPVLYAYAYTGYAWARPGVGAWTVFTMDGSGNDEDGLPNGSVTLSTSSMRPTTGTNVGPPSDGIKPGDMFLVIDGDGRWWWGDAVDNHLSETNGPGKVGFLSPSISTLVKNSSTANIVVQRREGSDGVVTVQYATADITAIAGRDYIPQAGTIMFGPGEILKTISVPLINDPSFQAGPQYSGPRFKVTLSSPAGTVVGNIPSVEVILMEDPTAPAPPPALSRHRGVRH
jgi:autotransporter-associated beta strand protein